MISSPLPPSIPYSDLWAIFRRAKRSILATSCLFGTSCLLYTLSTPTWYRSTATFQEKTNSSQKSLMQSDGLLSSLVAGGASSTSQQNFYSLIRSRTVLEPAIIASGLQARIRPLLHPAFFFAHLTDHLRLEARYWIDLFDPDTPFESLFPSSLRAQNLTYKGEETERYTLSFLSNTEYMVQDLAGNHLGTGTLGHPFFHPLFTITFSADPKDALAGMHFRLKLTSLQKAVERAQSLLTARAVKEREKLFQLTFYHPNRFVVSEFLNQLLTSYQQYHLQEAARFAEQEKALWLQQKQQAIETFEEKMRSQATARAKFIAQTGLVDPEKQLSFLLAAQQRVHLREEQIRQEQACCNHLLAIPTSSPLSMLLPSQHMPEELKKMVQAYVQDYTEKEVLQDTLKEQTLPLKTVSSTQFDKLDLPAARKTLESLQRFRQETAQNILKHELFLTQLQNPAFPLSSLTEGLDDLSTREILLKIRTLQAKLHDPETYLEKERLQIQHTLEIQRKEIQEHLTHQLQTLNLQSIQLKHQIHALQEYLLSLLSHRLSLHGEEMLKSVGALSESLSVESTQLKKEAKFLEESIRQLLPLISSQKIDEAHLEMQKTLLQERSKWFESTQAMLLQDLLRSAPVDLAIPPLFPSYPGVLFFTLAGSLLGAFLSSVFALRRARQQGLLASPTLLSVMGQNVIGTLSIHPAKNQELLRSLASQMLLTGKQSWILFLQEGVQITQELATLLEAEICVEIVKGAQYGSVEEDPEWLIQALKERNETNNKEKLSLFITCIPVASGRALQLMRCSHGSVLVLLEEATSLPKLSPIWHQALCMQPYPLFFLFTPSASKTPAFFPWRSLYLHFQKEKEQERHMQMEF